MGITRDMIQRNAIVIRTATGKLVRLDQTKKPVSCTLNPGTADEVTVMAHVVIVKHDLPDTLIGMSVIGPVGLQPCFYKQRLKYYIDRDTPNERKAFLRCQFPIDFGRSATNAFTAIRACTGAVIIRVKSPSNPHEVQEAQRRIADFQGQSLPEITNLFDRSMAALRTPPAPVLPVEYPAYKHIRPLDTGLVDKRHVLSAASSGMVVVELCSSLGATTEALLRQGVKIHKVYACENDAKMRLINEERLATFCKLYPKQISERAVIDAHTHLPHDIRQIRRSHAATMERPDLVVVGFPCQGFSRASGNALGLRDSRTKLLEEAIRVIHLINDAWPGRPCAYLFENVDATDHPQEDVRNEFNKVVRRLLGPGFAFDAVAVGSSAQRHRHWWTNLAPNNLLLEMVEKKFKLRNPDQYVQKHLEPGRQAQNARHSTAPKKHSVNVPGQPLRAFSTFVTVKGSHAFRPGQQRHGTRHLHWPLG
jgi:site-specific DNA-cytosine methylase